MCFVVALERHCNIILNFFFNFQEVAQKMAELKHDVIKLTANQLEEKIKHLTHGVSSLVSF